MWKGKHEIEAMAEPKSLSEGYGSYGVAYFHSNTTRYWYRLQLKEGKLRIELQKAMPVGSSAWHETWSATVSEVAECSADGTAMPLDMLSRFLLVRCNVERAFHVWHRSQPLACGQGALRSCSSMEKQESSSKLSMHVIPGAVGRDAHAMLIFELDLVAHGVLWTPCFQIRMVPKAARNSLWDPRWSA